VSAAVGCAEDAAGRAALSAAAAGGESCASVARASRLSQPKQHANTQVGHRLLGPSRLRLRAVRSCMLGTSLRNRSRSEANYL